MRHLILLSHHLNQIYIDHAKSDKVSLMVSNQQFRYHTYHQFRIIYHLSAAKHFSINHNISFIHRESWTECFSQMDPRDELVIYHPNDRWLYNGLTKQIEDLGLSVTWLDDINFFFPKIETKMKPPYQLNRYYAQWRKETGILMDGDQPSGGKYSFDTANRQRPPKELHVKPPLTFKADDITKDMQAYVDMHFNKHPKSNKVFEYPVTREDALKAYQYFLDNRLAYFGQYQDAMMQEHPFMTHSLISPLINLGLLYVKEVVNMAQTAYLENRAPIEAVEGFIRQILGWREYIRGVYLREITHHYGEKNYFTHQLSLPSFFYTGETDLNCLHISINETINHAYNHHIQRLMIIGNIANMMGIKPEHIRRWFNEMYIDAFDWVVTPNVIGMAMFADGGFMSTKPYISSANYIHKMSDYCKNCIYNPKERTGSKACPINALYYCFLGQHQEKLSQNPRMSYMYINYHKRSKEELNEMASRKKSLMDK